MSTEPSAAAEWRAHWPLVLAAMLGISQTVLGIYTLGLFMEPLAREFGWTRAQISSGITILSVVAIPGGPLIGMAIDRWGSRRLALPGTLFVGLGLAAFSTLGGSLSQWWMLWGLFALASLLISPPVWTAAVAGTFNRGRGLALAVMMCGTTVGTAVAPPLTQYLIAAHGWRSAFAIIGIGWCATILLVAVPFFFGAQDRRTDAGPSTAAHAATDLPGLTLREAVRDPSLCKIAVALLLLSGLFAALIVHFVPILTGAGLSRPAAASMLGLVALFGLIGKLATGWLLDHGRASIVASLTFGLGLIPCVGLLLHDGTIAILLVCTAILGWAMGSYLQASAYLTSRYAGQRSFGLIFGLMMSAMAVSSGVCPMLAGLLFDRMGSYAPLFTFGVVATAGAALLMATLGRYPDWSAQRSAVA